LLKRLIFSAWKSAADLWVDFIKWLITFAVLFTLRKANLFHWRQVKFLAADQLNRNHIVYVVMDRRAATGG
jgi:hypothetical protein